jgi:2'-5' RNA ligase
MFKVSGCANFNVIPKNGKNEFEGAKVKIKINLQPCLCTNFMKRIFAAIKAQPDEKFMQVLRELKKKSVNDKITWVDPANIHITLKFFGETDDDQISLIINRLNDLALQYDPFDIQLHGTGVFGSSYQPRVVWIGITHNPALIRLGQEILDEMERIGFKKDRQNFVPHLTLGRIKYIQNKYRFSELIGTFSETSISSETITGFHLIESLLSPKGPTYKVLESFNFKNEVHSRE